MTLTFYIDSSIQIADLALFEDGKLLVSKKVHVGPLAKDDIFVAVEEIIGQKKINYITLSIGPGSYTGMRVASIIATTLAYTLEIPLVTLTSLDGYDYPEPFVAVLDAKRGQVYLKDGNDVRFVPLEELKKIDKVFLTPHESLLKNGGHWILSEPQLHKIGKLSKLKFDNKEFTDPKEVNLLYLQNPYTLP